MLRASIFGRAILFGARGVERASTLLRGKGFGRGTMRQEVTLSIRALGHTPRLVVDGGGNIGNYTAQVLLSAPGCEVHVFEPAEFNIRALEQRFGDSPNVHLQPCGLSDCAAEATLYADAPGSGLGSLSNRRLEHFNIDFAHSEQVKLISLDEYWRDALGKRPIDLLKLDIEGHELRALHGGEEAIENTQVIQFEFGGCNIDSRTYFQDFYYFFKEHNFILHRITPVGPEPITKYTEDCEWFLTTNFIATRN